MQEANPILKLLAVHIDNSPQSQEEIARGADVSIVVISKIRNSKTKAARNRTIQRLMRHFGIDPRTLTITASGATAPPKPTSPQDCIRIDRAQERTATKTGDALRGLLKSRISRVKDSRKRTIRKLGGYSEARKANHYARRR